MGRDMAYDCWFCDLLCAASSSDLYRINLEQEVTSLQFDEYQGYLMAVGSSTGKVSIYDLRMSSPLRVKDHMYGSPISNIKWHQTLNSTEPKLITADKHIVRVWDPNTGNNMTSIEPDGGAINDVCIFRKSGLMLLALDNSQIPAHFIPASGPAPKWCSHLDNLTEMEEKPDTTLFDEYKFLTKKEMERLNLTQYIGSSAVRAYLHGFVVRYELYKKVHREILVVVEPGRALVRGRLLQQDRRSVVWGVRVSVWGVHNTKGFH